MNFNELFQKSNSSFNLIEGNVLNFKVVKKPKDLVLIDTGLPRLLSCLKSELKMSTEIKKNIKPLKKNPQVFAHTSISLTNISHHTDFNYCGQIGLKRIDKNNDEALFVFPKLMNKYSRRKVIWDQLVKIWQNRKNNCIKGFILNYIKGGYAIGIAGRVCFLPKTLCIDKKVYRSQWRFFSILNMNPLLNNIVVKERIFNDMALQQVTKRSVAKGNVKMNKIYLKGPLKPSHQ